MAAVSITDVLAQMSAPRLRALLSQEPSRSSQWIALLAVEGVAAAQVCYGRMLLEGTGVPRDSRAACNWFEKAAAGEDLDALNMLGRCLDNGWGCEVDVAAAARCFRRAADAGHSWAQYNAGHMFLDGRGVVQDKCCAFDYYLRAGQQGHERAMNLVGRCHEEGWGTPRDAGAAAHWYQRSAENGYFRGQYNWATVLSHRGEAAQAAAWFAKAAQGGTPAVKTAVSAWLNRAGTVADQRSISEYLR